MGYEDENLRNIHLVKKTISSSVRSTCEEIDIKLIMILTETGSTPYYFTGYDFKCPILAVCSDYRIARCLSLYKSVVSLCVGSLVGFESVISK